MHLSEVIKEDKEMDIMRDEEILMLFFNFQIKCIINIQRTFRGWKGRTRGGQLAIQLVRKKGIDFLELNTKHRQSYEVFERVRVAKEHYKITRVVLIQKIARGMIARRKFGTIKLHGKMSKYAVYVQRDYRMRLARLQLNAKKRDANSDFRFKAARRQRGMLLRMFGLSNRRVQSKFAKVLETLGIDPISFNYRLGELITETISDFDIFMKICIRDFQLIKEFGFNRLAISLGRRKLLASQGWQINMQDAVRIIEIGHKYEGYTGIIVRIDDKLPGAPLYEVKLDRTGRLTHVRMTTDPIKIYLEPQPLAKIRKNVNLFNLNQKFVIFGTNPDEPEFYNEKNIYAAWTIQRAYRVYRSQKIAARRRYEVWMRSNGRQWSLLNHLGDFNAISKPSFFVTKLLRLMPYRPIVNTEIGHGIIPPRLSSQTLKKNEEKMLKKEFEGTYRDRLNYLQKCQLLKSSGHFSLGFEKLTTTRKLTKLIGISYGLMFKRNKKNTYKLKDISGSKGLRLSANNSMVTGLDRYCFDQFNGSPHVRYPKLSLYQGEWSGLPLFTPLKPHGEGEIVFLDGWGFSKEDKVLYLTIVKCRYLNVSDASSGSSDPFCVINCNNISLQTSVKWKTLNPDFNESFEIDVSNPQERLKIVVFDKDLIGSDDFLGQIEIPISDFEDGKVHTKTYLLRDEANVQDVEDDRGEIEFRARWAERKYEDDHFMLEIKIRMTIRVQAWARRLAAVTKLQNAREIRFENEKFIKEKARMITTICRIRIAKKKFNKLYRRKRLKG